MSCPQGDSRGDGNANDDDDSVITVDSDKDAEGTAFDVQQQPRTPASDVTQLTSYRARNHHHRKSRQGTVSAWAQLEYHLRVELGDNLSTVTLAGELGPYVTSSTLQDYSVESDSHCVRLKVHQQR